MPEYVPVKARKHRYQQFAAKYIKNGCNGAQTAIDCGFTTNPDSAKAIAARLLTYAYVDAEINKYKERAAMTADDVLAKLSQVASLQADFKGSDIVKCNELLAKHHGLIKERVETVDVTERDAASTLLAKSIAAIACREGISEDSAAVSYFAEVNRDSDMPASLRQVANWPVRFHEVIAAAQAGAEAAVIEGGNQ